MAVPHPPPLPVINHPPPSPAHQPQAHPQFAYHLQPQQGQPSPSPRTTNGHMVQGYTPNPYGAVPPPPQAGISQVAMSSQQAMQQQQRAMQYQQQQQLAQQQAAAVSGQQPRPVIAPTPHHPSQSPHISHQGFPVNGTDAVQPQHYPHQPQPPGGGVPAPAQAGSTPASLRQGQSQLQSRQPQQVMHHPSYQQHSGMQQVQPGQQQQQPHPGMQLQHQSQQHLHQSQPPQPQPGVNGMAVGPSQHVQAPHPGMEHQIQQEAYAMSRSGSGGQSQLGPHRPQSETDHSLKIYVYDFLVKNNYSAAAAQFSAEAGLGEPRPQIDLPEGGVLSEWWIQFWHVFDDGKGLHGQLSQAMHSEAMNRLKSIRQQQLGMPVQYHPQQSTQYPAGAQQAQQQANQHQMNMRQQQQQAQVQTNGMTQAQAQLMQQQMQQQQAHQQQAAAQHVLMQQQQAAQRFAHPGQSASPVPRAPPSGQIHPMYGQQGQIQHMQLQPPNAQAGSSHSPIPPNLHLGQQQHPSGMPSAYQKNPRQPAMNGSGQPPTVRALTPLQAKQQQQQQQQSYAQSQSQTGGPPGPAAAMTPQQQQHLHQQMMQAQAQAQAMQHAAHRTLAEAHAHQQAQQQLAAQHQQQNGQPQLHPPHPGVPQYTNQQLLQIQQQRMQSATDQMYSALGLGQVNPAVMHQTAQELGLEGRSVMAMTPDDRQQLIGRYRIQLQESQRRAMLASNGGQTPTPAQQQILAQQQQMMQQAQAGQPRQVSGQSRPNGVMQGAEGLPLQSVNSGGARDVSPPERKRLRRNSGSAAPSPYPSSSAATLQPGHFNLQQGQTPQQQAAAFHQQQMQQHMQMMQNEAQHGTLKRQQDNEARMAYEKQMHQDQTMRSMQLQNGGFQPSTPIMSAVDTASPAPPAQMGNHLTTSPKVPTNAQQMQRAVSKGGAMLPPQSPANGGRAPTPKPGAGGKGSAATPKLIKEELREAPTPKSHGPSPQNSLTLTSANSLNDPSSVPASSHGLTPSPPEANTITPAPLAIETTLSTTAPNSMPSLSAASNTFSFTTSNDFTAIDGDFTLGDSNGGDFDISTLLSEGDIFDFSTYLDEINDGAEIGASSVP